MQRIWAYEMDRTYKRGQGIRGDMGDIEIEDGTTVQGGRVFMRGTWNSELHAPLEAMRQEGMKLSPLDVIFYKDRIPAMCGGHSDFEDFLRERGITTLLYGGANAEFCMLGSMAAANVKGFDTVLLRDATGTTNGEAAIATSSQVSRKGWGFQSSIEALEKGLESMVT
jgi:nicotinamidase-related amidase